MQFVGKKIFQISRPWDTFAVSWDVLCFSFKMSFPPGSLCLETVFPEWGPTQLIPYFLPVINELQAWWDWEGSIGPSPAFRSTGDWFQSLLPSSHGWCFLFFFFFKSFLIPRMPSRYRAAFRCQGSHSHMGQRRICQLSVTDFVVNQTWTYIFLDNSLFSKVWFWDILRENPGASDHNLYWKGTFGIMWLTEIHK